MRRIIIIFFITVFFAGTTAWVYATGNIPGLMMPENGISARVFERFPAQAARTTGWCGKLWSGCRRAGIRLPRSYNEELFRILEIRLEVDAICREIIESVQNAQTEGRP